ncbi:DUF1357 family protein (plasmid) [Borrelia hermsii DAH]|nr:DUF1357 family protein [Borrelia hermsii DAH]UPA08337.1 DUF1357 family protein [Borrelia hermsii DAH]
MNKKTQENVNNTQEDNLMQSTEDNKEDKNSITLSLKEYEEYKAYKATRESDSQNLSINERISKALADTQARLEEENKLLSEASRINEIDTLARKHLSSHFNKETLLAKGYLLKDIMQAQRRELVRKYVPAEDIQAIAKVRDTSHLDGEVLEQLVNLAKVNIKKRIQATSISSKGEIKLNLTNEDISILDPNFSPQNFNEFNISIANAYKDRRNKFYKNNDYAGDVNNNLLPFKEAYKLASNEIIKLINHFILTGTVSIQKDGKNQKRMLPNMYGLLNMPDQVKEEVSSSDKDKMDKIFEKIESGLAKLELGDEFSTPMMVLVDQATSLKLVKPYAIPNASSSSNIYFSTDSWEDFLVKTIKAVNNRQEVYIQTSNLLSNQILIYPLNAELIKFKPSKYMLPMPNEQVDKDSTDIAHSYIDFVLGGLLATQKTILRVDIKQS